MSKIPTKLTEKQFAEHIDPYLSKAKRGFTCQIPRYKLFNYILYWLHTGCQDEERGVLDSLGRQRMKAALEIFYPNFGKSQYRNSWLRY